MEALALVKLGDRAKQRPRQLSGGMQQRVALARAIVNEPDVLLLDEPLGALDLKLRREMQIELKRIQQEVGITFIHVTHDQEEAMTMADTVAVMRAGHWSRSVRRPISTTTRPPRSSRTSSASPTSSRWKASAIPVASSSQPRRSGIGLVVERGGNSRRVSSSAPR